MENTLFNNRPINRYELSMPDDAAAVVYRSIEDGRVILRHSEIQFEFSRQGYGRDARAPSSTSFAPKARGHRHLPVHGAVRRVIPNLRRCSMADR